MREEFDFDTALSALQDGQGLTGKDGILTPLIKQLTEAALQAEMDTHLQNAKPANRRNGSGRKTIKSTTGSFTLATPRDREGSFEPQLVKKHQTHMSDEIERKILSMFGLGMSYLDIAGHIAEIYGLEVSNASISAITDKLIPEIKAWQQRPLASHYPFVWLDAIHYKVKQDGRYAPRRFTRFWGLTLKAGRKFWVCIYLKRKEQTSGFRC
jgi:transposase-like protein